MLRKYILMVETFSFLIREICITNLFAITLQMLALARTFMFTPLLLGSVALQAIPFLINVFPLPFILFQSSVFGLSSFTKYIFLLYISDVNFAHSTNLSCDIKIIYLAFYSIVQLSDSLLKSDDNVVLYYG